MILSITGHRSEKLSDPLWVATEIAEAYKLLMPSKVIQGCANGADLIAAREAFLMDLPFVSARPWAGHAPRKIDAHSYAMMIKHSVEVVDVNDSENYPGAWAYNKRNEWMVDRADQVLAVWNGDKKGGTWNCVNYALKKKVPVYHINPTLKTKGYFYA